MQPSSIISRRQEWIIRICLVLFSVAIASGIGAIGFYIVRQRAANAAAEAGSEFSNLGQLRASLSKADAKNNGRVTLGSIIQAHPDDQMIYDLRPNLALNFQGAPVQTNSCGMRERELTLQKPVGTFRIAIIGDSFTFGWGVKEELAFPRQLEKILNNSLSRAGPDKRNINNVEVLNFGVPGFSPFQAVATFEQKALDYNPDAVVLFFIENDFGMPFFIRDLEQPQNLFASSNLRKLNLGRTAGNAPPGDRIADDSEAAEAPRTPKLPAEFDPNRALQKLAAIADAKGIRTFLAINPKKNWLGIHRRLWVLKNNHQIRFMNFYEDFQRSVVTRAYTNESLTLAHDQHPSPRKHKLLAQVMAPYFFEQLLGVPESRMSDR